MYLLLFCFVWGLYVYLLFFVCLFTAGLDWKVNYELLLSRVYSVSTFETVRNNGVKLLLHYKTLNYSYQLYSNTYLSFVV